MVIVLTARDQVTDRIRGLDAGADDYLIKPYDPGELLARLRAVERRARAAATPVLQLGTLEIDLARDLVARTGAPVMLTQKEWALLRVMAMRPERIHTRESLAGRALRLRRRGRQQHARSLRQPPAPQARARAIQTLRGLGYRLAFSPEDEDE